MVGQLTEQSRLSGEWATLPSIPQSTDGQAMAASSNSGYPQLPDFWARKSCPILTNTFPHTPSPPHQIPGTQHSETSVPQGTQSGKLIILPGCQPTLGTSFGIKVDSDSSHGILLVTCYDPGTVQAWRHSLFSAHWRGGACSVPTGGGGR